MWKRVAIAFILFALISGLALAHVPIESGENTSLETATHVETPSKSWAIYDELHVPGESKYYVFELGSGDRLRMQLYTPEKGFAPDLIVFKPSGNSTGTLPQSMEIPAYYSWEIVKGEVHESAEYEPFTPASYYYPIDYDKKMDSEGIYYVVINAGNQTGKFGLAIGYIETFSPIEWLKIPFDTLRIHIWEGQNPAILFMPLIIVVGLGCFIYHKWGRGDHKWSPARTLALFGTLWYFGGSANTIYQIALAFTIAPLTGTVIVTLMFVAIPVIGAFPLYLAVFRGEKPGHETKTRLKYLLLGAGGLFIWAGFVVGPVMIIILGLLPKKILNGGNEQGAESDEDNRKYNTDNSEIQ